MMKLACKDIDHETACDFETSGDTAEEVAEKMLAHAKREHSDELKDMGLSDEEVLEMMAMKAH